MSQKSTSSHGKKVIESFQIFIPQERDMRISIKKAYGLYFNLLFKFHLGNLSEYVFEKIGSSLFLGLKNKPIMKNSK